jgi:toxin HigB-1
LYGFKVYLRLTLYVSQINLCIFAVNISFDDSKLEELANDFRRCRKEMGQLRAMRYNQRLTELRAALSLEDVRHLPGRYHELTGDRKGQWACHLDHPYRLVFEPQEQPIPTDEHGRYCWVEIKGIEILAITNYHGK